MKLPHQCMFLCLQSRDGVFQYEKNIICNLETIWKLPKILKIKNFPNAVPLTNVYHWSLISQGSARSRVNFDAKQKSTFFSLWSQIFSLWVGRYVGKNYRLLVSRYYFVFIFLCICLPAQSPVLHAYFSALGKSSQNTSSGSRWVESEICILRNGHNITAVLIVMLKLKFHH